jgi:prolyl oligopeptidase
MCSFNPAYLFYLLLMLQSTVALGQDNTRLSYPKARKTDQIDDYHGTKVADPYRWLEDDRSAETAEWVKAQNEVTFGYLAKIPYRKQLQSRLEQVYNYPKYSAPSRKGAWFYFSKNDGLQNQSVLYRQKGLDASAKPELVIDPNKLSADGTTRLVNFSLSKDGRYAVVGTSKGGSDWQTFQIMDLAQSNTCPKPSTG